MAKGLLQVEVVKSSHSILYTTLITYCELLECRLYSGGKSTPDPTARTLFVVPSKIYNMLPIGHPGFPNQMERVSSAS